MKKISFLTAAVAVMLGFTSCESTTDPKLAIPDQDPTAVSFEINQPVIGGQALQLAPDGTFDMIVNSQPDYGAPLVVSYSAQVSLTGNWGNPAEVFDLKADGQNFHTVTFKQNELAVAITALSGYTKQTDSQTGAVTYYKDGQVYTGPVDGFGPSKVYLRGVAQVAGVKDSKCYSNAVEYKQVDWYLTFKEPQILWIIGGYAGGWIAPEAGNEATLRAGHWYLEEPANAIESDIYVGTFDMSAGDMMFRFYTKLTGWDADSYGSQADDNPVDQTWDGDKTDAKLVKGKGSYNFPDNVGTITIVVDMKSMKTYFYKGTWNITVDGDAGTFTATPAN